MLKKVVVRSSTWQEEAPVDFEVIETNFEKGFEFPFTLQNPKTGEKEVFPIKDTMLVILQGKEENISIAISESLLYEFDEHNLINDEGKMIFELKPDKKVYELGMSVGLYFSFDELPKKLKDYKIQLPE